MSTEQDGQTQETSDFKSSFYNANRESDSTPPTKIHQNGAKEWRNEDGDLHRTDGPAIVRPDGTQEWFVNGLRHRNDGPAYIDANGTERWFQNGVLHRDGGPAAVYPDGWTQFYQHGLLHNAAGPANIMPGREPEFFLHGKTWKEGAKITAAHQAEQSHLKSALTQAIEKGTGTKLPSSKPLSMKLAP